MKGDRGGDLQDRACFERPAVLHSSADIWAQWIPRFEQFWLFPFSLIPAFIHENDEHFLSTGRYLYYTHNDGQHGEECVYVPLATLELKTNAGMKKIKKLDIERMEEEIGWGTPVVLDVAAKLNEIIDHLNKNAPPRQDR